MLTKKRLEELFEYRDGGLYWRVGRGPVRAGARAGNILPKGYRQVMIDGRAYYEHRLVWLLHHGQLPKFLDHVNGDKSDNCIENLRACTKSQNEHNTGRRQSKTVDLPKGVFRGRQLGTYRGQVVFKCRRYWVGQYKTIEEADAAVRALREKLHGEFARHE